MILLVKRNLHDLIHDMLGDVDLFGTLHFDDIMTYAMSLNECEKSRRILLLYEGAMRIQYQPCNERDYTITYTMLFNPRDPRYSKSSCWGKLLR